MNTTKHELLNSLRLFILSKPGIDPRNYSNSNAYHSDRHKIQKHKTMALELLTAVSANETITVQDILDASRRAFRGRLTWDNGMGVWCYVTGQYYPTEYRLAAASVLAHAIWEKASGVYTTGDKIRKGLKREFSLAVYKTFFK